MIGTLIYFIYLKIFIISYNLNQFDTYYIKCKFKKKKMKLD